MCYFHFFPRMNEFSLSCQPESASFKKKNHQSWGCYFGPFLFFIFLLSNLSPSLTSSEVRRSSPTLCPGFFHMGLKSASSQIRIDSFVLFCKLKISHSFDADRNRCPLQSVELLEAEPERASFFLFSILFFSSPRSWRKRPEKSIKSMNGFPSKTRAFKGETEGWGECFWRRPSKLNEIMGSRTSEQIRSRH